MLRLQSLALVGSELSRARDARIYFVNSLHILIKVSFILVVPIEPQASASTVTLLCRSMRVRIPPSLLLLKDHSF